jgi:hypothetical protein
MVFKCSYARAAEKVPAGAVAGTTAGGTICASTRQVARAM